MKSVSNILKDIYMLEWKGLNILECGANHSGEETVSFELSNNCWYIEPNIPDYNKLKNLRKNTLNLALSDNDGIIKFIQSSHPGNSSCEYSEEHLSELKMYGTKFTETEVECISYESLLNKLNLVFDILVLDVEGHEKTILKTFKNINKSKLPNIIVIECGYDWEKRLDILKEIGYRIDCYYFNNCYLSMGEIKVNKDMTNVYNNEFKSFIWRGRTIYNNELI